MRRGTPAGDVDYETRGIGYADHRQPDPRIAARIWAALGGAETVINVGAGAGSYEPLDRLVVPVEPSAAVRSQRPPNGVPAVDAVAEALPFDDDSFDAGMAILSVHQWCDANRGLRELRRVSRGPVVIVTFDRDAVRRLWLRNYAPDLYDIERFHFPPIEQIRGTLGGTSTVSPVPVPLDCTDGFAEAYYGRPEAILDPDVRRSQSGWSFVEPARILAFVEHLRTDLADGTWDARHGHLRSQREFVGSLRIIRSEPPIGRAGHRDA